MSGKGCLIGFNTQKMDKVAYIPKGSLKAREMEPCKNCGYYSYIVFFLQFLEICYNGVI